MEIDEELGEREVERKKWVPFHVSSLLYKKNTKQPLNFGPEGLLCTGGALALQ